MGVTTHHIANPGGPDIAATWFTPKPGRAVQLTVLISPATAVPQGYYRAFAEFLAAQGCEVLCWDWSGIGQSATQAPLHELSLRAWGQRDLVRIIDWAEARASAPLVNVGHSAGGQVFGLAPTNHKVQAMLTVASQHGYWRHWSKPYQPLMWAIWFGLMPAASRLLGRIPGALLGGDGLPGPIAQDWARSCRSPHYFTDDDGKALHQHFHRWQGALRMITVADDPLYGPVNGVQALGRLYRQAQVEHQLLKPTDWDRVQIGHFGWFRRNAPLQAWHEALQWLQQQTSSSTHRAVA